VDFDVIPPVSDDERLILQRALQVLGQDWIADGSRATSAWWRRGVEEAVGSADDDDPRFEPYVLSPRKTRGATRA
jgi:hypothetical protein